METPENDAPTSRSRRRRNVVGSSPHREEYVRLMKAGWTAMALERYAGFRFGEDIPSRTFRQYRQRHKIEPEVEHLQEWRQVEALDVVSERATLIQMQKARIDVEVGLEIGAQRGMNKLLSTTRHEIFLLSALLDQHKADLQDLGLMPKAGEQIEITTPAQAIQGVVPKAQSLGALIGLEPGSDGEAQLARVLHMQAKKSEQAG